MRKIRTSELCGTELDWAVAKCEGKIDRCGEVNLIGAQLWCWEDGERMRYAPSDDWSQGGSIIERERISLVPLHHEWEATLDLDEGDSMVEVQTGSTPLIAAMRCYVASNLGETVKIPT